MPLLIIAAAALISVSGRTALADGSPALSVFAAQDAACSGRASRRYVLPAGADFRSPLPVSGVSQVLSEADGASTTASMGAMSMWCARSSLAVRWCPDGTILKSGASCPGGFYAVVEKGLAGGSCAHGLEADAGDDDGVSMLPQRPREQPGFSLRLASAADAAMPRLPPCGGAEGARRTSDWKLAEEHQEDSRRLSEDDEEASTSKHQTFGAILLVITMAVFVVLILVLCVIDRLCYSRRESASLVPEPS